MAYHAGMNANKVIDALGGTAAVARLCNVRSPSVSEWRRTGIPAARVQYLQLAVPRAFDDADDAEAELVVGKAA